MPRSAATLILYRHIAAALQLGVEWDQIKREYGVGSATISRARDWAIGNVEGFRQPSRSAELYRRILAAYPAHHSKESLAEAFEVSPSLIRRALKWHRAGGI